jgi:hypothetical protein
MSFLKSITPKYNITSELVNKSKLILESEIDMRRIERISKLAAGILHDIPSDIRNIPLCNNKIIDETIYLANQAKSYGPVDWSNALAHCQVLNDRAPPSIFFNYDLLVNNLEGGACSAMSLVFLRKLLNAKKQAEHLEIEDIIRKVIPIKETTQKHRNVQAAFNTISIQKSNLGQDSMRSSQDKIQALLNFYGIEVEEGTPILNLSEADLLEKFDDIVDKLPSGIYVMRMRQEVGNHKGEEKGHTAIMVKDNPNYFIYEPNKGLVKLKHDFMTTIYSYLANLHNEFDIPHLRIYKVKT